LAAMLKQQDRRVEAITQYQEIVLQRPDFVAARLDLAQLYLKQSRSDAKLLPLAIEQLAKAQSMAPEFWKTYLVKAEAARLKGENSAVAENYAAAKRRAPDRAARREIRESEQAR
jgi:tetratricopeptide (TPR) repeat protein